MASLVPCPGCARHVRANEPACPFCDAELASIAPRVVPSMPNDRLLARAALTFAAAAATTLTACGKEPNNMPPPAPTNTPDNLPAPAYGPPPMMEDASSAVEPPKPAPTSTMTSQPVPAYGVPPIDRHPPQKK